MRDMTPAELSKATGIGEGAISQYRKGAYKASQRNLDKIATALKVSIPWLMGAGEATIEKESHNIVDNTGYSQQEKEVIKKYRALDEHGTKVVDLVLDAEYTRCTDQQQDDDDLFVAPLVARSGERRNIVISKKELESLVPSDEEDL